ncbi:unnamed protein product [Eruca vesicaria subsp. sativa]|uniref:CCR4-NOT transcription complex subunit 11 n=1 Tax=Eruca vesicaria subsp. sativa TaxID=29727 RepID=A0ABC8LBX3_ERUVS|nr:unnamed protein product [Eruca vesicaria subsp. sativa]
MEETAIVRFLLNSDLRPIVDILAEFNSKFPRARHLTVFPCSYRHVLSPSVLPLPLNFPHDLMLLPSTDRIIAFAIIYQCYSSKKPSLNPFISDMMNAACNEQVAKHERALILHLLQWNSYNNAKEKN